MKRHILSLATLTGFVICFNSCSKDFDPSPEFVSGTTICLQVDGKTIHTYNSNSWQASYRTNSNQYRIFSDDNKDYYKVTCSAKPDHSGQELKATITWGTKSSPAVNKKENIKFKVQRIDESTGTIWLWSSKSDIGVAILKCE